MQKTRFKTMGPAKKQDEAIHLNLQILKALRENKPKASIWCLLVAISARNLGLPTIV